MFDINAFRESLILDAMRICKCSREEAIEKMAKAGRKIKEFQDRKPAPQDWRHFAQ